MKRFIPFVLCLALTGTAVLRAQEYPFQDTKLSEEERLDNAVSLMTVDEKIMTIVGQGVPRLGIAGPGATEAIHGIVRPAVRSRSTATAPPSRRPTAWGRPGTGKWPISSVT